MKLEKLLARMITKSDYRQCWQSSDIPAFRSFFDITVDRVKKILPSEYSDLSVQVESGGRNRIHVGGNFNTPNTKMKIWGQIVWLPKSNKFRGKLGTSEVIPPKVAPTDLSNEFNLVYTTDRELNEYGASFSCPPQVLTEKFGSPPEGDNFKVSGMYIFEGNRGSAFRLHDYEATSLYWDHRKYPGYPSTNEFWSSTEIYEFRVAGSHDPSAFLAWLKKGLKMN